MFSVPTPSLCTVSCCVVVVFFSRSPKASVGIGVRIVGLMPRPDSATGTEVLPTTLVVSVSVASFWPVVVGANVTATVWLCPAATLRVVLAKV